MNGYVNVAKNFADAIAKFVVEGNSELTVAGIYKYFDSLLSINKLCVANGSIYDGGKELEYNFAFNVYKRFITNDYYIILTITFANLTIGISINHNDKISKIGG